MRVIKLCIILTALLPSCDIFDSNNKLPSAEEIKKSIQSDIEQSDSLQSNLKVIRSLEEGLKFSASANKPILLCFTGYAVVYCRRIEAELLLKNKTIYKAMKDDYINVWLFVDDKRNGEKWSNLQNQRFNNDSQPYFIILNSRGESISKGLDYNEATLSLESDLLKHRN